MGDNLHRRALQRAADLLGGARPLARHLNVSRTRIGLCLDGNTPVPDFLFVRIVDLLLEFDLIALTMESDGAKQVNDEAAPGRRTPLQPRLRG